MRRLFAFQTKVGTFYICEANGRYMPVFQDESLGSYARPDQAAEDLAIGATFSAPGVRDTSTLGIPENLGEWDRVG